jgi:hypothetical protein
LPPDLFSPQFDYGLVDGLGRARQRAIEPRLDGKTFRAEAVGPIIEVTNLVAGETLKRLRSSSWFEEGPLTSLLDAVLVRRVHWLDSDGRRGLVSGRGIDEERVLTSFKIDAHKAALGAGFAAAPLLIAAMGELIGNVVDHSEAPESGVAIFAARPGMFEFVVADSGIGVLRSVTKNPEHARLQDEGAALTAIVESSVSRFERGTGHGNGFRPIFERLADMTGELRFRSGDYALSLDGRFGDRIGRQLSQKPRLYGFFAAVVCQLPRSG